MKNRYKLTLTDILLLALVIALGIYVIYRVKVGLQYKWRWPSMLGYIFREDSNGKIVPGIILNSFLITIKLAVWSTVAATIIGVVMGIIRSRKGTVSRLAGLLYVAPVRNIPPIVLVFIFYFFIGSYIIELLRLENAVYLFPDWLKKIITLLFINPPRFPAFLSAVITMGIYEGAYITEIIKAGINSVDKGQWEAAKALGLSRGQVLRYIILPQAVKYILPPLSGQFISCIKDSAIVSVISIPELTFQGLEIMAATRLTFEVWIVITVLYFILTFSCSWFFEKLFARSIKRKRYL